MKPQRKATLLGANIKLETRLFSTISEEKCSYEFFYGKNYLSETFLPRDPYLFNPLSFSLPHLLFPFFISVLSSFSSLLYCHLSWLWFLCSSLICPFVTPITWSSFVTPFMYHLSQMSPASSIVPCSFAVHCEFHFVFYGL